MRVIVNLALLACASFVHGQDADILTIDGTVLPPAGDNAVPTGSQYRYITYASTVLLTGSDATPTSSSDAAAFSSRAVESFLDLIGTPAASLNITGSATSTAPAPSNTQPCNGYPEFCSRKYSNMTQVAAHNSPFAVKNNVASNQYLDVTTQLNDGIRMLQGQVHYENDTLYYCHTNCGLLNAGTVQDYLTTVAAWIRTNPYNVVTILFGNSDVASPQLFNDAVKNSGLGTYVYTPPKVPMSLDDWPTPGNMILRDQRVVVFLDYQADQNEFPSVMDEFSQLWETPFSPTDTTFPCDVQRPPGLIAADASSRLYMANHNLNTRVEVAGLDFLIPNTADLNVTNAVNGTGSLGLASENCENQWNRPPNFLLVDFYNVGSFNGSVFQVAADANNVTYRGGCCGSSQSSAMRTMRLSASAMSVFIAMIALSVIS